MTDFTELIDLASERLGGFALAANDEFFAPKENLVHAAPPVFRPGEYTDRGKWMDGWETRRRRELGHDWCLVRLGAAGIVHGVVVDTSHFRGNFPESCSIEGYHVEGRADATVVPDASGGWFEILPRRPLQGDMLNRFAIEPRHCVSHVRLNIFPDGGVARLRVYGRAAPDLTRLARPGVEIDLAAVEHGGLVAASSDMFFGSRHNLIMPGLARDMGDGWETRRRRDPGHDWAIVELGAPGTIRRIEVDTTHFKGNAPESCSLEACAAAGATMEPLADPGRAWRELLPRTRLQPHARHVFIDDVREAGEVTHVRFNIFPDGGVGRLRLYGIVGGSR